MGKNDVAVSKSGKKGNKRDAEAEIEEKKLNLKKQKVVKKEESSSDEDDSSSDDDEIVPVTKKVPAKKADSSSSDDESDSEEEDEKVVAKKQDSIDDSSDDSSDEEDDKPAAAKKDSSSDDSSEEESSDGESAKPAAVKKVPSSKDSSSESDEDSSEDEKPAKIPKKANNDSDEEMEEAEATPVKAPKTPATSQAQSTGGGSKTLFAGNLAFSIDKPDVIEFFKQAGEVADVRFSSDEDGRFKGFGHVEFVTEEGAKKAVKLNGQDLLGRPVRLDFSRERGDRSDRSAFTLQRGGHRKPEGGKTIYVRGFDISCGGCDEIQSALESHFKQCGGEITRVYVPKDYDSGAPKGIAYIDFSDADAFGKALEMNGSEFGDYPLTIEEARPREPRDNSGYSGNRGNFSGGRRGGGRGDFSGGRGRFSGGRDGGRGRGRSGGRDGGRGRGRGATPYAGKKTTFDD